MDRAAPSEAADRVRALLAESIAVKRAVLETQAETVVRLAEAVEATLRSGGTLYLCGNGGSAADAQHLAAELLVRLRPEVERPGLPAVALALDSSSLTAHGNDLGFVSYYERLVEALGRPGDALLALSTSGRSENVLRALRAARRGGLATLGLLGGDGGACLPECDVALVVASPVTGRVQEAHIAVGHALLELVEDALLAS